MPEAENLQGKEFGYLKVIERAKDHVAKSGQKKVRWLCECKLCGNRKEVNAQELKRGSAKSCGCYRSDRSRFKRNQKACIICGTMFDCPPSDDTVTCSKKCNKEYAKIRNAGRVFTGESRRKMSEKAKGRDMTDLQAIATQAAKESPKSGRFETNINAKDWHLISPDGKHYCFHSLMFWMRENCQELFGCKPDSKEMLNAYSGIAGAKRAMLGGKYSSCTYKGWRVIPTEDD